MRNKNVLRLSITGVALALSMILLSTHRPSAKAAEVEEKKSTCCKKVEAGCPGKKVTPASNDMILENLSTQFISFSPAVY